VHPCDTFLTNFGKQGAIANLKSSAPPCVRVGLASIESLTCRHMFTNITTKAGVEKNCKVKDVTPKNHMIVIIALFL